MTLVLLIIVHLKLDTLQQTAIWFLDAIKSELVLVINVIFIVEIKGARLKQTYGALHPLHVARLFLDLGS